MTSESKISPNYHARAIVDLDPGTLFFAAIAGGLKPYLLATDGDKRHLVALSDGYLMAPVANLPNVNQTVYVLSQEWRFCLVPFVPQKTANPTTDRKMLGKITICKGLRAMTVDIGNDDLYLLDIDQLSPADDTGLHNHRGLLSDWIVETRSSASEPWTTLFNNTGSAA